MELIKRELGPDAVILKSGKATSPTGSTIFEVQAAVDRERGLQPMSRETVDHLKQIESKIEEVTHFLSLLVSTKDQFTNLHHHEELVKVYHYLLMQELDEKKLYLLLSKAITLLPSGEYNAAKVVSAFCRELMKHVKVINPFQQEELQPHTSCPIYTFLGPTGVGKTTTIAKLAAMLRMERGLSVGLITLDNYRIRGADQLKTYAHVLDLPFMSVQGRDELEFARKQMANCHLIFLDTTGRNFLTSTHVEELVEVFDEVEAVRHFLVLSATAKDKDLMKTIQRFEPLMPYGIIFTKLDETLSYGSVVNQLLRFPYPIAYFGTGQRVPEDIEQASKHGVVTLLFPRKRSGLGGAFGEGSRLPR